MNENWIKYLDPVESLMSLSLSRLVANELSFPTVWYKEGQYRKTRIESKKSTIIGRSPKGHLFYSGLIPRILKFCQTNHIEVDYDATQREDIQRELSPVYPKDFTARSFQPKLIDDFCQYWRGVIISPTGSGKTITGLSLIKNIAYINSVIWLCHTKDLLHQTAEEAVKFFGPRNVGLIGDGRKETDKWLTIATRQSFKDLADDLGTSYDMLIVDEGHHITSFKGEYATILSKIFAPIRLAITATKPTSPEAILALESFIGPTVGEYTFDEGIKEGFLATPKIKIIKLSKNFRIRELRTYKEVYDQGVVRRLDRNKLIVELVKEYTKQNLSCLIVVSHILHGDLIMSMCKHAGLDTQFIFGDTDSEDRVIAKHNLNNGNIRSAICTTVWKEGINIPELNVIINAAGGKSEIATLQTLGRGVRRTADKSELILHDFFDPSHPYLLDHFGERISLYCDNNWL